MLSPELQDAAEAFGHVLREAPAVSAYRAACDALAEDFAAQRAMVALQAAQSSYLHAQQTGANPTQDQVDQLRAAQAAVRSSDVLMNHLRATNAVKAYLPTTAAEVSAGLGADYAALVAPASSC